MRTEEPRPVRLQDYRPPDWLIETVNLDVSLHPTATTVKARLRIKPNAAGTPAPLVLDGEELKLRSLTLDDKPLGAENFVATPDRLTIAQVPNRPFELTIETVVDPTGNTQLMGLYRAGATYCTQCEAEGFRRITYFLDRPDVMAVYTTRIEAEKKEAPILRLARSVPETVLSVRAGRRQSRQRRGQLHHDVRTQGQARHLC
jgi:aminopeptidase N